MGLTHDRTGRRRARSGEACTAGLGGLALRMLLLFPMPDSPATDRAPRPATPSAQPGPHPRRRSLWEDSGVQWPLLRLAVVLAVLGLAVAPFDVAVADWFRSSRLPGDLGKAVMLSEAFAHGVGAAAILLAAWLLDDRFRDGRGRRCLLAVVLGTYGGGLVTDLIKSQVARVRPRSLDFATVHTTLGTFATPAGVGGSNLHSFPSGHSAVAAGLACTLAVLYPRGRWLFAALAVLACCQRVVASAHYPSDVAWGAAIGIVVATWAARRVTIPSPDDSCQPLSSATLKDC